MTGKAKTAGTIWPFMTLFLMMVPITIFADARTFLTCLSTQPDKIVCRYSFPRPAIKIENGIANVSIEGLENSSETGKPLLPVSCARIVIPAGKKILLAVVEEPEVEAIPGTFVIRHGSRQVPLSYSGAIEPTPPDMNIYGSNELFPAVAGKYISVQQKHGYSILIVSLNPVRYRPGSGRLFYAPELEVNITLETEKRAQAASKSRNPRRRPADISDVTRLIDNPSMLEPADDTDSDGKGSTPPLGGSGVLTSGDFEHVIITTEALLSTPSPYNFQALSEARNAIGITSTNIAVEWIYTNYPGTRPDGGTDNQTRIRNFVADAYTNWDTRFIVLGGMVTNIPVRKFWVQASGYTDTMPVDMYYGCLDGTFDYDADGTYGEPTDGPGGGEVDLAAEVYIGRFAVANTAEVARVVRKTFDYEQSSTAHLAKVTMLGQHLGFGDPAEYAKTMMEQIRNGGMYDGYTTVGFENSVYSNAFNTSSNLYDQDAGYPPGWSKQSLIDLINSGVHVLNHLGHATPTHNLKLYTSDLSSLTNIDYFFAYSQGCDAGRFDDCTNCFAESITTMDKGAVAVIMNVRYGWGTEYSTDGPSHRYNRRFWDAVFDSSMFELGRMNQQSKEQNMGAINQSCMRWCYYEITLFGDPAMPFARRIIGGPPTITHTALQNSSITNTPYNVDAAVTPGSLLDTNRLYLFWNTNGATNSFFTNNCVHFTNDVYRGQIAAQPRGTSIFYWVQASTLNGNTSTHPSNAPASLHRFEVTDPYLLTVSGIPADYGTVNPGYGSYDVASGVVVTAVADLYTDPSNDIRHACTGWTGSGSVPTAGNTNTFSFTITNNSSITWQWALQYSLSQTSSVAGILSTTSWWMVDTTAQTFTAESSKSLNGTNYCFAEWWVDGARKPDPTNTADNPAGNIAMTTSRVAVAVYLTEDTDEDGDGLGDWWEYYYFGSTSPAAADDFDGDNYSNLWEYLDRTDPKNSDQTPQPPFISHTSLTNPQTAPAPWTITATVTDNYSVASVTLWWNRNSNGWQSTNMTSTGVSNQYTNRIPAPGTNTDSFIYRIAAQDPAGWTTTNGPYSFNVVYPVIVVNPTNIGNIVLLAGTLTNRTLNISNTGNTNLEWQIDIREARLSEDVESGTNGWSHSGTNDLWHISTNRAYSSTHSWYCGNTSSWTYGASMHARLDTPSFHLGTNAQMTFWHWIDTELESSNYTWDGSIIEISTNNGASFEQITPVGGYPYLIQWWSKSPWPQDTPCFAGTGGWQQATFDLSSNADMEVIIRFHFGSDDNTQEEGWYVDDIVIFTDIGTNQWLTVSPDNGILPPASTSNVVVSLSSTNIPTGEDRAGIVRITGNDPTSPTNNVHTLISIRSSPYVSFPFAAQTSTNGAGYVTLSNTVYDADRENCELEVLYSINSGSLWTNAWILNAQSSLGSLSVSNGVTNQISGIVTTNSGQAATNQLAITWDTTNSPLQIVLSTNILMRTRVWDGLFWSAAVTSQPFMVDNEAPTVPSNLAVSSHVTNTWSTNNLISMSWGNASDGNGAGMAGYGYTFTNSSTAEAPSGLLTTNLQASSAALADGTNWWAGVRAIDEKGNAGTTTNAGPYWIDATPPSPTGTVISISHSAYGNYVFSTVVTSSWTGFSDPASGIAGYYYSLTNNGGTTNGDWTTGVSGVSTGAVMDQTNYVYVWARDNVGLIGLATNASILALSAGGDFDQDGLLNSEEEISGTDAGDAGSVFGFQSINNQFTTNMIIVIQWDSITGRVYSLYNILSLTNNGGWSPIPTFTNVPGTGSTMCYTDTVNEVVSRFYKITVSLP